MALASCERNGKLEIVIQIFWRKPSDRDRNVEKHNAIRSDDINIQVRWVNEPDKIPTVETI